MTILTLLILAFLVFGAVVFVVLAVPLIAVVHCVVSQRSAGKKVLWILFMVFFMPLASYFYGLFASRQTFLRVASGICLALVLGVLFSIPAMVGAVTLSAERRLDRMMVLIDQLPSWEFSKEQSREIHTRIQALKIEMGGPWFDMDTKMRDMALIEMLGLVLKDSHFSSEEYRLWSEKFETRQNWDAPTLKGLFKRQPLGGEPLVVPDQART